MVPHVVYSAIRLPSGGVVYPLGELGGDTPNLRFLFSPFCEFSKYLPHIKVETRLTCTNEVTVSVSLCTRWCIRRQWWLSVHWPSMRSGQRLLTSPCRSWRLASASWCLVATGPSLRLPSLVNLSLFCSFSASELLLLFCFLFLFLSLPYSQPFKGCRHVDKTLHMKWNILFSRCMLAKLHLCPDLSGPQHPEHINISSRAGEAECASCFLKSQLRQSILDTLPHPPPLPPPHPPPPPPPVVQMTRNWSVPLCSTNVLYSHWSETVSEGMYWTLRVFVPVYQAMCQYARVCVFVHVGNAAGL